MYTSIVFSYVQEAERIAFPGKVAQHNGIIIQPVVTQPHL